MTVVSTMTKIEAGDLRRIVHVLAGSVVNPIGYQGAESNDAAFNADEQASISGSRALRLVCWYGRSIDPISHPSDCPSNNKLSKRCGIPFGRDLDDYSKNHDTATHHHRPSPSKIIPKRQNEDSTEQTTYLIDCGHEALHCRIAFCRRKDVVEGWGGDDAGHYALIIAK